MLNVASFGPDSHALTLSRSHGLTLSRSHALTLSRSHVLSFSRSHALTLMNPSLTYFTPYQTAWIEDPSPLKLIQKSRQIGISHANDYHSVILASGPEARFDVFISSRDEIQA